MGGLATLVSDPKHAAATGLTLATAGGASLVVRSPQLIGLGTASAGTAAAGGNALFQNGQRVQQLVQRTAGNIEVGFRVAIDGAKLHLSNLSVFPEGGGTANVGTGQVLSAMRQLFDAAKAQGFEQIRITGYRLGGADPGHIFDITKDLTK